MYKTFFLRGCDFDFFDFLRIWPKFDPDHQALLFLGSEVKFLLFTIDMESDFSGPDINMCIYYIEEWPS